MKQHEVAAELGVKLADLQSDLHFLKRVGVDTREALDIANDLVAEFARIRNYVEARDALRDFHGALVTLVFTDVFGEGEEGNSTRTVGRLHNLPAESYMVIESGTEISRPRVYIFGCKDIQKIDYSESPVGVRIPWKHFGKGYGFVDEHGVLNSFCYEE